MSAGCDREIASETPNSARGRAGRAGRLNRSRWVVAIALAASVGGCLAMVVVRARLTDSFSYRFLVWNLFLACVPFPLAWAIDAWSRARRSLAVSAPLVVVWLLFFPNAPYLMTDLIHLGQTGVGGVPPLYDALLFAAFAATGALLGFSSLYLVHASVTRRFGPTAGWAFAVFAMGMGSYGLYLGRIQRWNSWDAFVHPRRLLHEVLAHARDPFRDRWAALFTVLFAVFLLAGYGVLLAFSALVASDRSDLK